MHRILKNSSWRHGQTSWNWRGIQRVKPQKNTIGWETTESQGYSVKYTRNLTLTVHSNFSNDERITLFFVLSQQLPSQAYETTNQSRYAAPPWPNFSARVSIRISGLRRSRQVMFYDRLESAEYCRFTWPNYQDESFVVSGVCGMFEVPPDALSISRFDHRLRGTALKWQISTEVVSSTFRLSFRVFHVRATVSLRPNEIQSSRHCFRWK